MEVYLLKSPPLPQADVRTTHSFYRLFRCKCRWKYFYGIQQRTHQQRNVMWPSAESTHFITPVLPCHSVSCSDLTSGLTVEVKFWWLELDSSFIHTACFCQCMDTDHSTGTIPATGNLRIRFSKRKFRNSIPHWRYQTDRYCKPTRNCCYYSNNILWWSVWYSFQIFLQETPGLLILHLLRPSMFHTANTYYTTVTDGNGCTAVSNNITKP